GANLVFWSLVEWGPGSRDFSWRALAPFVAGFGLVSGMLLVLDTDRRQDLGDRTERTAPESPLAGSAQAGGGTGPENPASPAGGKVHGEEGSSPGPVQEPTEPDTFPALKQRLLAATVRIVMVPEGAQGTGTIIDASPPLVYVLTACHVVEGAQRLDVFTFPESPAAGQGQGPWSGEVIARAKASDLALVRLVGRGVRVAPVRVCPPSLVPGFMPFPVLTAGCDGGGAPSCQTDILRGKVRAARWDGESAALYWEALHPPAAGRSGGAIVGRQGYLLGVCSGSYNHKGYYVSLEEIDRFLKDNGFGFLLEQNGK
ncbi:MAG: trypsin-like peptidase domain-containing protein, partial [Planctomycetes bacterium]|nr:trypsin-like peptidase domain-containing protein [Planctomycetota bacterium]